MSIATEIQRLRTAKEDIKTAIEEKGVEVGNGLIDTYAEKIKEITGGGGDVIDLARYAKTFQFGTDVGLPENLVLNLDTATYLANFISNTNFLTVKHLTINCPNQITSMNRFIYGQTNVYVVGIEHLTLNVDTSKNTSYRQAFQVLPNLKTIDGTPLDFSSATEVTQLFSKCDVLEEVRVVKESIKINISVSLPSASDETIQSFVDGLADMTGQTAPTLTVHTNIGNKLTDEQKATITAKNWTLVY